MFAFNKLKIIKISTGSIQSHGLRGKNVLKTSFKMRKGIHRSISKKILCLSVIYFSTECCQY